MKEEYIALVEESAEINGFIFGEGLPVYKRDGSEEEKLVYQNLVSSLDNYESVRDDSKYLTIEAMK
ncbi:MAG: hypothetical protein IJ303_02360, partial [Clostridia bacterium]|nr:hypothetical protein [Clostridia bacterium]